MLEAEIGGAGACAGTGVGVGTVVPAPGSCLTWGVASVGCEADGWRLAESVFGF